MQCFIVFIYFYRQKFDTRTSKRSKTRYVIRELVFFFFFCKQHSLCVAPDVGKLQVVSFVVDYGGLFTFNHYTNDVT